MKVAPPCDHFTHKKNVIGEKQSPKVWGHGPRAPPPSGYATVHRLFYACGCVIVLATGHVTFRCKPLALNMEENNTAVSGANINDESRSNASG